MGNLPGSGLISELPGLGTLAPGEHLAGNLPAGFIIPPGALSVSTLQAIMLTDIIALPAGALPGNTAIPVDSLGGFDPALADAVINGQIVASLLPEDLPIPTDVIDPAVVASVLHAGVSAALLPKATPVQINQLPGL